MTKHAELIARLEDAQVGSRTRRTGGSFMLKWLKGALDHWAVSDAKSASDNFEAERYLRELRRKAYIRSKAREHIEIMKAVREMEKAD